VSRPPKPPAGGKGPGGKGQGGKGPGGKGQSGKGQSGKGQGGKGPGAKAPTGADKVPGRQVLAGGRGPSGRELAKRVHTARKRSHSSTLWLHRQLNDPYVAEAKRLGFRSRAAFKLQQLDDRFRFLRTGGRVLDLGCAPGGWLQIAAERVGAKGRVVGIDLLPVDAVPGTTILLGDFLDEAAPGRLRAELGGPADVVLSDMAANTVGHTKTDSLRTMALAEAAAHFAAEVLAPGGSFVCKVLQGGTEKTLLDDLKRWFKEVRHVKPAASRADSSELYLVALGFRGGKEA
jgi:23S rRNA (uridine2552-2'-O)-methyltransferase